MFSVLGEHLCFSNNNSYVDITAVLEKVSETGLKNALAPIALSGLRAAFVVATESC